MHWIAPLVLCAIGLNQLVLVHASALSRWKGGGFGMFATVDSPGARFLRIYLVTESGRIPTTIPTSLRDASRELRTLPTAEHATELARKLAAGTWVYVRMQSPVAYYTEIAGLPRRASRARTELTDEGGSSTDEIDFRRLGFVRMLESGESVGPGDERVDFSAVQVEVLGYRFDRASTTLVARPLIDARAPLEQTEAMQ